MNKRRFSRRIQLAEVLNGIIVKGNDAVALRWNSNSQTSNKKTKLNTFWFWEKKLLAGLSRRFKKAPARLYQKRRKIRCWGGAQVGFESLNLMTEGIGNAKLL